MSRFKELGGDKYKSKFAEISQKLGTQKSAKITRMRVRKEWGIVENYHPKTCVLLTLWLSVVYITPGLVSV